MTTLNLNEKERYARHLSLKEIGEQGQIKLKEGSVLCIGSGGLGSPAAIYLAAAGVGKIGIIDNDVVEPSNLQRQIIHGESSLGLPKVESASQRLKEINPLIEVITYNTQFNVHNALQIAQDYDIILDGSDNFTTRYLSNDAAFFLKKPNVYGAVMGFEGQVSVFAPHLKAPCYRCMIPTPPKPHEVPSCADFGVLGALPGIIGTTQALEAIKLILSIGTPLTQKILHVDTLSNQYRTLQLNPDPNCKLCGRNPTITSLTAEIFNCSNTMIKQIDTHSLKQKLSHEFEGVLLDVRTPLEHQEYSIPGNIFIPLQELPERFEELPKDKPLYIYCKGGVRSLSACSFLLEQGFTDLTNVEGGIIAYQK